MKTQLELIEMWDNLPSQEKMAMGDHYISNESNLHHWDKPFSGLSELKKSRVLKSIESFLKIKNHCIVGSGIN